VSRLRSITQLLLVAFLVAACGAVWCRGTVVSSVNCAQDARANPLIGENIFRAKCAVCHGVDGAGRTPNGKKLRVPDLRSNKVQDEPDDELLDVISNGKGDMPPFRKKYSADKLQQVITYVRSFRGRN
jgi:mono/diheme cytochrome c family protein